MKRLIIFLLTLSIIMGLLVYPAAAESRVESILAGMTLEQKVSQMMMMSFQNWDENTSDSEDGVYLTKMTPHIKQIIEKYKFGAIIYFAGNIKTTEDTFNLTLDMQEAATKDGGIPLLIATDQEGGNIYRLGSGTALPGNMALGATNDPKNAYTAGTIIGRELSSLGINTTLAPVVDVNNNPNNPVIGLRSYNDNPETVGLFGVECIKGLANQNTIGCVKHFPGHGDTATDSHYGLPKVDKSYEELIQNELKPYESAIKNGIDMIMTAHILYPQLEPDKIYSTKTQKEESLPATMSNDILTGILKGKMNFDGVVCTDAMTMAGVAENWDIVQSSIIAINAGVDIICMPVMISNIDEVSKIDDYINNIVAAVKNGTIDISRIDDACRRILALKEKRGILDYKSSDYSLEKALSTVGCKEHRDLEREISAKAVTVTSNKNTLPLKLTGNDRVLMLTPYDNECGLLAMGWNRAMENNLIPNDAKVDVTRYQDSDISEYTQAIDKADKVIIVSEISSVNLIKNKSWAYTMPQKLVQYAKSKGKTVVVMSVDKPYDVQLYSNADAVLAVYGYKGSTVDPTQALIDGTTMPDMAFGPNISAGVEVIFGVYGASGKLPINIPELDFETLSYTDKIIYPNGYGITYNSLLKSPDDDRSIENTPLFVINNARFAVFWAMYDGEKFFKH